MFGFKKRFFSLLSQRVAYFQGPEKLMINPISFKCNHRCPMCWLSSLEGKSLRTALVEEQSLKIEDYLRLFSNLPRSVKRIEVIGGGEPLLYPGIEQIFRGIKERKLKGYLVTNGSLLGVKMAKVLSEIGWDKVRISFSAATADTYKKVNGVDDFNKVISNIKEILNYQKKGRPEVSLHYVIQKYNYKEIYDFGVMSKINGISEINFDYLLPHSKAAEKLLLSDEEWLVAINQLKQVNKLSGLKNNINEVLELRRNHPNWNLNLKKGFYFDKKPCYSINKSMYIFGDGGVLPCCVAKDFNGKFNIKDLTIAEIWHEYSSFRKKINGGKYYNFCVENCNMG